MHEEMRLQKYNDYCRPGAKMVWLLLCYQRTRGSQCPPSDAKHCVRQLDNDDCEVFEFSKTVQS